MDNQTEDEQPLHQAPSGLIKGVECVAVLFAFAIAVFCIGEAARTHKHHAVYWLGGHTNGTATLTKATTPSLAWRTSSKEWTPR